MFVLTEEQQAVCSSMRRFAQRELRWRARKLDTALCSPLRSHHTTAAPWTA
jgi:hypothetical protein